MGIRVGQTRLQVVVCDGTAEKVRAAAKRCRVSVSELLVLIIKEAKVETIQGAIIGGNWGVQRIGLRRSGE